MQRPTACKWNLQESNFQSVAKPIAPRQTCEKVWTLHSADAQGMLPWIRKIHISCPGFVFVSTSATTTPSNAIPVVRATSQSTTALQAIVVKFERDGKLILSTKKSLVQHFLLVEITLPIPHALKKIKSQGSAVVVVEDHVLVADQPQEKVGVKLTGSGSVFVESQTEIHAKKFKATLTGSGTIQITSPSLVLHDVMEASVVSSGNLRVFAGNLYADKIRVMTAGSGELQFAAFNYQGIRNVECGMVGSGVVRFVGDAFQATKCSAESTGSGRMTMAFKDDLQVEKLSCKIMGSGGIAVGCGNSRCAFENVEILGSGSVDVHDVAANSATVKIMGSGSTKFRAFEEVRCERHGSGEAVLCGSSPQRMVGNVNFKALEPAHVHQLLSEQSAPLVAPSRAAAFEYSIQASAFAGMATAIFGVFRDIWQDLAGSGRTQPAAAASATPVYAAATAQAMPMDGPPPPPMKSEPIPAAVPATATAFVGAGTIPTVTATPVTAADAQIPTAIPVSTQAPTAYPGPSKQIP